MQRIFHTPEGVRDIYNGECSQKHHLQAEIYKVFRSYGYEEIETPSIEYFEVFSKEVGTVPSRDLYKFFDREGNTLVLRPDFTPSVSRACATYFNPDQQVVTLCYTGNTFVNNSSYQGRLKETTQMGVERIGDDSPEADAELLAMTIESLLASGLTEFQISVGQVDYFKSLLKDAGLEEEVEERLRSLISQKNYFGVEDLVKEQKLSESLEKAFLELPHLFGTSEVLAKARSLTDNTCALAAVERLEEIYAQYGRYLNKVDSFEFPGLTGMEKMASIMQKLRDQPLTELAGHKVVKVTDYKKPEETGLPAANVLIYTLENGATVVVRPSGTEPKIKTYFTTLGKDLAEAQAQKDALAAAIEPILK